MCSRDRLKPTEKMNKKKTKEMKQQQKKKNKEDEEEKERRKKEEGRSLSVKTQCADHQSNNSLLWPARTVQCPDEFRAARSPKCSTEKEGPCARVHG